MVVMADEVTRLWRVVIIRVLVEESRRDLRMVVSTSRDLKSLDRRAGLFSSISPFVLSRLMS